MLRISPVAQEIRNDLITKSASVDDALSRCAHDLHLAHVKVWQLEAELARAQREASAGYLRRAPSHPARVLDPPPPSVDDEWVKTGVETAI
jgi:hypothetical protein